MDLALKDKVVLVAGSSRGIGRAIAAGFLEEGARVTITGREKEPLEAAARAMRERFGADSILSYVGDLTETSSLQACLRQIRQQWGKIDAVVANIGNGKSAGGWEVKREEWDRLFQVNFLSTVLLVNEVMPMLIENGSGSLVIISSIAGVEAMNAPLAYSSAKSALATYAKNLSRLVAAPGVRVNVVAPGNIFFPGGSWERHSEDAPEKVKRYIESEVPMARFGSPDEIANFVVFLSSARASFATGLCAVVDGGQTRTI